MVAMAAERVMQTKSRRIDQRRTIVLDLARDLAPCGLRIDPGAMLRELEAMDGARRRAVVRDLLSEFDKLSDVKRQGPPR